MSPRTIRPGSPSPGGLLRAVLMGGLMLGLRPQVCPGETAQIRGFARTWEQALRRTTYRTLFSMLASEFPENEGLRSAVLTAGSSFMTVDPSTRDEPDGFRRNIRQALREVPELDDTVRTRLDVSLDWFLAVYLPLGEQTLVPISSQEPETMSDSPTPEPGSPPGVETMTRGFDPRLSALDRESPHSVENLRGYLSTQVGIGLEHVFLDARTHHGFTLAGVPTVAAHLMRRGFNELYTINVPGFMRRKATVLGFDPDHDRVIIYTADLYTEEQLLNHQARIYWLEQDGRRVSSMRVERIHVEEDHPFPGQALFMAWVKDLDPPVDTLAFGLMSPMKKRLRHIESRRFKHLDVWTGLRPSRSSVSGRRVLALSGFGASFGTLPARIHEMISNHHRVRNIAFIGTAGGLKGPSKVDQWVVPGLVTTGEESPVWFRNAALDLDLPDALSGTIHTSVFSILSETRVWTGIMLRKGVASVDCELEPLIRSVMRFPDPPRIFALLTITDFPVGPDTGNAEQERDYLVNSNRQLRHVQQAHARILVNLHASDPPQ